MKLFTCTYKILHGCDISQCLNLRIVLLTKQFSARFHDAAAEQITVRPISRALFLD